MNIVIFKLLLALQLGFRYFYPGGRNSPRTKNLNLICGEGRKISTYCNFDECFRVFRAKVCSTERESFTRLLAVRRELEIRV